MFSPSSIAVLECAATRTTVGVFQRRQGQWHLRELHDEKHAVGADTEAGWLEATCAVLPRLRERLGRRGPVHLVLPSLVTLTKMLRAPAVGARAQARVIEFEARQAIPYAEAEVYWGAAPARTEGAGTDFLLAAVKRPTLDALLAAADRAGLAVISVMPAAPALAAALSGETAAESASGPHLLLELGERTTHVVLAEAAGYRARAMPGGMADNEPASRAGPRLAREVERTLAFLAKPDAATRPGKIWITGEQSALPGLTESLAAALGQPLAELGAVSADDSGRRLSAVLTGSARLAGRSEAKLSAPELLPADRLARLAWRTCLPWLGVAAALALGALLPPLMHYRSVAQGAANQRAALEAEVAPWRERQARIQATLGRIETLRGEIALLEGVQARRDAWVRLLASLQEQLVGVEDVWLEKLQVASAPGEARAPVRLALSGRMLDRTNPLSPVSEDTARRVKALIEGFAHAPLVTAVEGERFDASRPGVLQFDCVLVVAPDRLL